MTKRKLDLEVASVTDGPLKRVKTHPQPANVPSESTDEVSVTAHAVAGDETDRSGSSGKKSKKRVDADAPQDGKTEQPGNKIRKLAPPRPFPTVPASVSATGPRSAHTEGKNYICITRRTGLGAYLNRCKDVLLKDGHKTLHLSAMGAAIPHLMQLAISLPPILPFSADEIRTEVFTGTVEVQDELLPEDEDGDISYCTRDKSSVSVVITIGDGVDAPTGLVRRNERKNKLGRGGGAKGANALSGKQVGKGVRALVPEPIIIREDQMDDM